MTLSDLASIGSLVSGVAVLISLIYLALQMRQSERNQRAMIQQARASRTSDLMVSVSQPGIIESYYKVMDGDGDVSIVDIRRFGTLFRASLYGFEDAYFQHKNRLLDDNAFASTLGTIRWVLRWPGVRVSWKLQRQMHDQGFAALIDSLLLEVPVGDFTAAGAAHELAQWREMIAAETAGDSGRA
jgi:hypothetical protein